MKILPTKVTKRELRREMYLTRPPRMEGKVKEAMMQPVRKAKKAIPRVKRASGKPQGYNDRQRKDYQLRSKRH